MVRYVIAKSGYRGTDPIFAGIDVSSGGYPYLQDNPYVWYDLKEATRYLEMFKNDFLAGFLIYEIRYELSLPH